MTKIPLIAVILASLVGATPALAEETVTTIGAGMVTCQFFAEEYRKNPVITETLALVWAQGFMLGDQYRPQLPKHTGKEPQRLDPGATESQGSELLQRSPDGESDRCDISALHELPEHVPLPALAQSKFSCALRNTNGKITRYGYVFDSADGQAVVTLQHEGEEAYTYKQSYIAEHRYITLTSTRGFTPGTGFAQTMVIGFHGGNIEIERPRLRSFEGKEQALPSWEASVAVTGSAKWAMNQMLINVATREFARSVRLPAGDVPAFARRGFPDAVLF